MAAQDPWENSTPTLCNPPTLQGGDSAPQGQSPLGDSAPLPATGVPIPVPASGPSLRDSPAERARHGAAPRHQARKMRRPPGAQRGQVGVHRPMAKMEKTTEAGSEKIRVVILVSNRLTFCISSEDSARVQLVQDLVVNGHVVSPGLARSLRVVCTREPGLLRSFHCFINLSPCFDSLG